MRVLRITVRCVAKRALAEAAAVLRAGGVVAFPTETSYGLAADPVNPAAVRRVYAIKGRPSRKPLPFIAASRQTVEKAFLLKGKARVLAARHWPGPLTLVLPLRKMRLLRAAARKGTGAVRVPSSAWARALAHVCGGLVTSTSANVSGDAAAYDPAGIRRSFAGKRAPDLFLDAGILPKRTPSTIVRVKRGMIEVLREGPIKVME